MLAVAITTRIELTAGNPPWYTRAALGKWGLLTDQHCGSESTEQVEPDASEIVGALAHDLRNPLCSVRAYAGLLERDYGPLLGEEGRTYVDRIRSNLDRMHSLIEDLLALGQSTEPLVGQSFVKSREVLLQLAAELKPRLDERGISLELPANPPPIFSVRSQFHRVLSNLVSNAIDHMGEVRGAWIRLDLQRQPTGVELLVQDNGKGIPPGVQERIFERFFPACSSEPSMNCGLGLAIVKRIVEAHGGSIRVESSPGQGAAFRALFPEPS